MSAVRRLHQDQRDANDWFGDLPAPIARLCEQADISRDHLVGLVVWFSIGSGLTIFTVVAVGSVVALFAGLVVVVVPIVVVVRWSGRRTQRLVDALPATVDTIARSLRSGASFSQSLREATEEAPKVITVELGKIVDDIDSGADSARALTDWADRAASAEVRIVAAALALASENEAGSTRALEGVGQSLRDRAALNGEIRALTAQASASLRALVLLPIGFVALDAISTKAVLGYLIAESFGHFCLVVGVCLEVVGWMWMRTLVQRQLPT